MIAEKAQDDVILLILDSESVVIPLSISAFKIAQSSQKELDKYIGGIVLTIDNKLHKIVRIYRMGFAGKNLWGKIKSALIGAHNIRVELQEVSIDIKELKDKIFEYIQRDLAGGDPYLPQTKSIKELQKDIDSISNQVDIFKVLKIPAVDNCLDVL